MPNTQRYTEEDRKRDGESVQILGVAIDSTDSRRVIDRVGKTVRENGTLFITTPNPEIVLQATRDAELQKALNGSDIAIADGVGLILAQKFLKNGKPLMLLKGRDLFISLIQEANLHKWNVVLLGNRNGSAEEAAKVLRKKFTSVLFHPMAGPQLTEEGEPSSKEESEIEKRVIKEIGHIKPELLFVAFGAPRQEKWIYKWKGQLHANVFMVVGGAFDYVSGKVPTPPSWWPQSGEWAWRLVTQPKRWKRIINATVVFPRRVLQTKFNTRS